jgi:hypothetical protein
MRLFQLSLIIACLLHGTRDIRAQASDHAASGELNRALGVECVFCHGPAGAAAEAPSRATARRMMAMVTALNEQLASTGGRVTCWTCHAGARVPAGIERSAWERVRAAWPQAAAPATEPVKRTMAIYTASVGRTCAGCHDGDGLGPASEEAVTLVRAMNGLFPIMEKFLPSPDRAQCFLCHKGRPHPQLRPAD